MARSVEYAEENRPVRVQVWLYTCDKCGKNLDEDPVDDDTYIQDLRVYLNPNECVSFGYGRDYCIKCVKPIWEAICKLIDADPESTSKESLESLSAVDTGPWLD